MKNIPIVYSLEDLKNIYDKEAYGIKGMWAFHAKCHDGHKKCAEITKAKTDWLLGVYWNNFAAGIKKIIGSTIIIDDKPLQSDIDDLTKRSDVVMVFTGNYHPYMEHYDYLKSEFDKIYTLDYLEEKGLTNPALIGSLIYSVFSRILMHEIYNIKIDFHTVSGKDSWRFTKYNDWVTKRFGITLNVIEPVEDKFGNVISGIKNRIPEHLKKRINKKLLQPHFKNIKDVENNIKDIKDMNISYFVIENGWMQAKFNFGKYWWLEGKKCQ